MYDFHKTRHENNENEFSHKLFIRGEKNLLVNIQRKIPENQQCLESRAKTTKGLYLDKIKKDYKYFVNEVANLKACQEELEKNTKLIIKQNNQFLADNKMLWTELLKNREKNDRKIEKLILLLISYISQNGQQKQSNTITNTKYLNNNVYLEDRIDNGMNKQIEDIDQQGDEDIIDNQNMSMETYNNNKNIQQNDIGIYLQNILSNIRNRKTNCCNNQFNYNNLIDNLNDNTDILRNVYNTINTDKSIPKSLEDGSVNEQQQLVEVINNKINPRSLLRKRRITQDSVSSENEDNIFQQNSPIKDDYEQNTYSSPFIWENYPQIKTDSIYQGENNENYLMSPRPEFLLHPEHVVDELNLLGKTQDSLDQCNQSATEYQKN